MNLEHWITTFGYAAIFVFMVTNGIVSLPSSQFVYVVAGFFVPSGQLDFFLIVIVGTIGNTIGNVILYEVSRSKGLKYVIRWRMFREEKIARLHLAFERRGVVIITIGKFLPGVKVIVPVVAGIARMHRVAYVVIITITSLLWAMGLTYVGVYFGRSYHGGAFGWTSAALIALAIIAIYVFHRYVKSITVTVGDQNK